MMLRFRVDEELDSLSSGVGGQDEDNLSKHQQTEPQGILHDPSITAVLLDLRPKAERGNRARNAREAQ